MTDEPEAKKVHSLNAERMLRLFAGSNEGYGTHGVPTRAPDSLKWEIKSTAKTLRGKVTVLMWEMHLAGKTAIGIIAIRADGMVIWASIDWDVYNANPLEIIERIERAKLPLVPVRSKSGGLHLYIFFKDWIPASDAIAALRDFAAKLGVAGSEIFPKQQALDASRGDLGNWIVMPYFGSTFGGKLQEQVGLKKTGAEMTIEEFLQVAENSKVDAEELRKHTRKRTPVKSVVVVSGEKPEIDITGLPEPATPFGDGPPCLETLATNGVQRGVQSDTLLMMGMYYKRRYPEGEWETKLHEAAAEYLTPPGDPAKTLDLIRSLNKKPYFYTCRKEPFLGHCNAAICRTRLFGVGEQGAYPVIFGLMYMKSDPPIYFVQLAEKMLTLNSKELQNYQLFLQKAVDQAQLYFSPMAQKDWHIAVQAAIARMEPVDNMPEGDISEAGRFVEILEDFLTSSMAGEKMDDVFGRPYLNDEDGHYYFRLRDFDAFVQQQGIKTWSRGKLAAYLRDMKGEAINTRISNKAFRGWKLAKKFVEDPPIITPPKRKESPI